MLQNPSIIAAEFRRDEIIRSRKSQITQILRTAPLLREVFAVAAQDPDTACNLRRLLARRSEYSFDKKNEYKSPELGFAATRKFTAIFSAIATTQKGRDLLRAGIAAANATYRDREWSRIRNNSEYHTPEIVIGSGPSSANYRSALQTLNPKLSPLVIDAQGFVGGQFSSIIDPIFRLNSRSRPLGTITRENLPGTESPLNTLGPYCPIQESDLTSNIYGDQTNIGLAIELNHLLAGGVLSSTALVRWNRIESKDGRPLYVVELRRTDTGETARITTNRITFARGLGTPNIGLDLRDKETAQIVAEEREKAAKGEFSRYRVFPQFLGDLADRSSPFPLQDISTTAVLGAGDGGNVAVEALLGFGPTVGISPIELDRVKKVLWFGQKIRTKEEFEKCERARYVLLGLEFPRESNPNAEHRIFPISGKGTKLRRAEDGKLFILGPEGLQECDLVIDCSGYDLSPVEEYFDPSLGVMEGKISITPVKEVDLLTTAETIIRAGNAKGFKEFNKCEVLGNAMVLKTDYFYSIEGDQYRTALEFLNLSLACESVDLSSKPVTPEKIIEIGEVTRLPSESLRLLGKYSIDIFSKNAVALSIPLVLLDVYRPGIGCLLIERERTPTTVIFFGDEKVTAYTNGVVKDAKDANLLLERGPAYDGGIGRAVRRLIGDEAEYFLRTVKENSSGQLELPRITLITEKKEILKIPLRVDELRTTAARAQERFQDILSKNQSEIAGEKVEAGQLALLNKIATFTNITDSERSGIVKNIVSRRSDLETFLRSAGTVLRLSFEDLKKIPLSDFVLCCAFDATGSDTPIIFRRKDEVVTFRGVLPLLTAPERDSRPIIRSTIAATVTQYLPFVSRQVLEASAANLVLFLPEVLKPAIKKKLNLAPSPPAVNIPEAKSAIRQKESTPRFKRKDIKGTLNGKVVSLATQLDGEDVNIIGPECGLSISDEEKEKLQINFIAANIVAVFLYSGRITTLAEQRAALDFDRSSGAEQDTTEVDSWDVNSFIRIPPQPAEHTLNVFDQQPPEIRAQMRRLLGDRTVTKTIVTAYLQYAFRDCYPEISDGVSGLTPPLAISLTRQRTADGEELKIHTTYKMANPVFSDPLFCRAVHLLLTTAPFSKNIRSRIDINVPVSRGRFNWSSASSQTTRETLTPQEPIS